MRGVGKITQRQKRPERSPMTEVYLDDSKLELTGLGPRSTLGEIVEAVETDLRPYRRFIQELWVDGINRGAGWKEASELVEPLQDYSEVRLVTEGVDQLVLKGIYTVKEYISFIGGLIERASNELRRGSWKVDNLLGSIIESTGEVVRTMDSLYRCGLSYGIDIFRQNPCAYYESILNEMSALRDARLGRDNVLLADILEYELGPLLGEMMERVFYRKDN